VLSVGSERTPGFKLFLAIIVGLVLTIPLFSVWLLVYDRKTQSEEATASITEGWGGTQAINGPLLVIPYRATATETVVENGQSVTRSRDVVRELTLAPEIVELNTEVRPQVRKRSIYEAVVYDAHVAGKARFAFPPDLVRTGVDSSQMDMSRAELRFGLSDLLPEFIVQPIESPYPAVAPADNCCIDQKSLPLVWRLKRTRHFALGVGNWGSGNIRKQFSLGRSPLR